MGFYGFLFRNPLAQLIFEIDVPPFPELQFRPREIETLKAISSAWLYGSYDISHEIQRIQKRNLKLLSHASNCIPPKSHPTKKKYWIVFEYTNSILGFTYRPVTDFGTFACNPWNPKLLQENARLQRHVQEPQLMANMEVLRKAGAGRGKGGKVMGESSQGIW